MADIITRNLKSKRKLHNTKVDLTPMVDLGFLLITFFVFTSALSTPKAIFLGMPLDDGPKTAVAMSGAVTMLLTADNIIYYEGELPESENEITKIAYANTEDLRHRLLAKKNLLMNTFGNDDKLMVMIKAFPDAGFGQVVDMIDEMIICNIRSYALLDPDEPELAILKEKDG